MTYDSADRLTLFAAASARAPLYFTKQYFNWSCHYNILFQPAGLAVPDSFFFSPFMYEYFADRKTSTVGDTWLERALEYGLIIPYVRDSSITSFAGMLDAQVHVANPTQSREIVERLRFLEGRTRSNWRLWPNGLAEKFACLIRKRMLERSVGSWLFEDIYEQIRLFCDADIPQALTAAEKGQGLRLTNIVRATATRLLGPEYQIKNRDVIDLIYSIEKKYGPSSPNVIGARIFYKVLSELYNENIANEFRIANNLPGYDLVSSLFSAEACDNVLAELDTITTPALTIDIELPSLALLESLPFQFVLETRRASAPFGQYCIALSHWRAASGDNARSEDLIEAVKRYAAHLVDQAPGSDLAAYRVLVGKTPARLQRLAKTAVPLLGAAGAATVTPVVKAALELFGVGPAIALGIGALTGTATHVYGPKIIDSCVHLIARPQKRASFTAYPHTQLIELQNSTG